MAKHDLKNVEDRIGQLRETWAGLAADQDLEELLLIMHRPGWTTPAELLMVRGLVESLHAQTQVLMGLKQVLMNGGREVRPGG